MYGVFKDIILARASDETVHTMGQDGGLVSAILLWAIEHGYIDAALVSYLEGDGTSWKAIPGVAKTRAEILAAAGSRETCTANPLTPNKANYPMASPPSLVRISCQSSRASLDAPD